MSDRLALFQAMKHIIGGWGTDSFPKYQLDSPPARLRLPVKAQLQALHVIIE